MPAQAPANSVDPGEPGSYRTVTGEYDLDPVRLPGFDTPVEMTAEVVAPKGATGSRPLALFLHGRHSTCCKPGSEDDVTGDWPCADGYKPIPSHKGYLPDQQLLASEGYVTVSISANGINAQDWQAEDAGAQARSSLVRQHLARWADWTAHRSTAPAVVREAAKADLSRVLLVGHSRGGEGVNRAAMDSLYPPPAAEDGYNGPVRWKVRGTVLVGPTIFGQNPVADVPDATLLPSCDGGRAVRNRPSVQPAGGPIRAGQRPHDPLLGARGADRPHRPGDAAHLRDRRLRRAQGTGPARTVEREFQRLDQDLHSPPPLRGHRRPAPSAATWSRPAPTPTALAITQARAAAQDTTG